MNPHCNKADIYQKKADQVFECGCDLRGTIPIALKWLELAFEACSECAISNTCHAPGKILVKSFELARLWSLLSGLECFIKKDKLVKLRRPLDVIFNH